MENKHHLLAGIRRDYGNLKLNEQDISADPLIQFNHWFQDILAKQLDDPTAMVLSTVDAQGAPDSRVVLLKGIEQGGFVFYTNYTSAKGLQLQANPHAALNFYWPSLVRQVRVRGLVHKLTAKQSEAYFSSRPRASQISATASPQSQEIPNREALELACQKLEAQYHDQAIIPCPKQWGGYVLVPNEMEFWQGRDNRLHDRVQYTNEQGQWVVCRLAP